MGMDWQSVATGIASVATVGIPLYLKIRNLNFQLKEKEAALNVEIGTAEIELRDKKQISTEAEWKRVLEFRDIEYKRLKDRDDQQEAQLKDLWEKYIAILDREARADERLKSLRSAMEASEQQCQDRIKALIIEIQELKRDNDASRR